MKKRKIITVVIVFGILIFFIVRFIINAINYYELKDQYTSNFYVVDRFAIPMITSNLFYYYLYSGMDCPKDISDLIPSIDCHPNYEKLYIDLFSIDSNDYYHYIPLYDSLTDKREGFILLSRAIDGRINNDYTWKDSIYIHEINTKLNLYNIEAFNSYSFYFDTLTQFNFKNFLFGKKDVAIAYVNCFDRYKNMRPAVISIDELVQGIYSGKMYRGRAVNILLENLENKLNNQKISIQHKDYQLFISLELSKIPTSEDIEDNVYLTGTIHQIDTIDREVFINKAILYVY